MIHFVGLRKAGSGGGGGGGGGGGTTGSTVGFSPGGGSYAGTSLNVTVTVTNAAKLRWKIAAGSYTTVNATSTVVAVPLVVTGKVLYADALSSTGSVLATNSAFYQKPDGGQ